VLQLHHALIRARAAPLWLAILTILGAALVGLGITAFRRS
jgi:hypothetical protein